MNKDYKKEAVFTDNNDNNFDINNMKEESASDSFNNVNGETGFGDKDYFDRQFAIYNKEESEKKKIKSAAAVLGIPLLIIYGISTFWSQLYFFLTDKIGISRESAYGFATDSGTNQVLQVLLSCLMFTLPFILSFKISGRRVSDTVPFKKVNKSYILPLFAIGVAFCFFSSVMVSFSGGIFEGFGVNYEVDFGENAPGFFGLALTVISTAIIPALVEEFAFRGFVLGVLLPFGDAFAIISSSLIFGILHGNFEQMPFAVLVGLVLGYIRVKTDSLWIGIFVHFFNNFISVADEYLADILSAGTVSILYSVMICVFFALAIISIIYLSGKEKFSAFKLKDGDYEISEKNKYKWFFTSVFVILVLIAYFVKAFKFFV